MARTELIPGMNRFFAGLNLQGGLEGWGRVRWGQSYDQVKTFYPQAEERNGKLVFSPDRDVQRLYTISMSFDSGHMLESVTLSFAGSQETADFATLSEALTRRLGAPTDSTAFSNTWRRDDSQVTLSMEPDGSLVLSEQV